MKNLALLVVVLLCAVLLFAAEASASDTSWLIALKASYSGYYAGAATFVGVGTSTNLTQSWGSEMGITRQAEQTSSLGDTSTTWHMRHDDVRQTEGGELYYWDLKIGAQTGYEYDTIDISLWNNQLVNLGTGGELNHSLAYVFAKRVSGSDTILAWFSDSSLQSDFTGFRSELTSGLWHDTSVLLKNATAWTISPSDQGFYVTDTVTKGSSFGALADYRLYAFDLYTAENWPNPSPMWSEPAPEPTSLLALSSGILGAAGVAMRRRRS